LCLFHQLAPLGGGDRERLVHDHVYAGLERGVGHRHVLAVGGGDDGDVDLLEHLGDLVHHAYPGMVSLGVLAALGIARDDRRHRQAGRGRDQGAWNTAPASPYPRSPHGGPSACRR
jgi:hypothetical protein